MNLQTAIKWRYATKRMLPKKVKDDQLQQILEAIRFAPSSRGLQPFKVFIIEDNDLKNKIQPIADRQAQIVECSHLLIFAVETNTTHEKLENYIKHLAKERNIPVKKLDGLKSVLLRDQLTMNEKEYYHWSAKQAYIALSYGQLMANTLGIDAAAMEGFNSTALDNFLNLQDFGLKSAVLLAIGYRDEENDYMLKLKKVRKPESELFHYI